LTDKEEEKEEQDNKESEDEDDSEDDGQDNEFSDKEEELENDKNAEGSVTALNKEADKKKRKLLEKYTSSPGKVCSKVVYIAPCFATPFNKMQIEKFDHRDILTAKPRIAFYTLIFLVLFLVFITIYFLQLQFLSLQQ